MTRLPVPRPAFLSDDALAILRYAVDAHREGVGIALVTLVQIDGGAARRLGAQMAVRGDGLYCGYVSGGCTEAAVAIEALQALSAHEDRQVRFGQGSPYFDIVLPCGGGITLAIHVIRDATAPACVLDALLGRRPAGLRYDPHVQRLQFLTDASWTGWTTSGAFDVGYRPAARLLVHGAALETGIVRRLAETAGYAVTLPTEPSTPGIDAIDADTAVVLLHHDLERELPLLQAALAATPFYIGALGSWNTQRCRAERLAQLGYASHDVARIKAPIGVFPKARDATALALSVLGDVAAARTLQLGSSPGA